MKNLRLLVALVAMSPVLALATGVPPDPAPPAHAEASANAFAEATGGASYAKGGSAVGVGGDAAQDQQQSQDQAQDQQQSQQATASNEGVESSSNSNVRVSADSYDAIAMAAPVYSTICSGGASLSMDRVGLSVGDAEHYCALLHIADAWRSAAAMTHCELPVAPKIECTAPSAQKGDPLQGDAFAFCARQLDTANAVYTAQLSDYQLCEATRQGYLANSFHKVEEAAAFVDRHATLANVSKTSKQLMLPVLLIKGVALLFGL